MTRLTLLAALLTLAPIAASAQIIDAAKVVAGDFEVSNSDHDKTCSLTLKAEGQPTAMKLDVDKGCTVPAMKDVAAWMLMPDDSVRLLDSRGRIVFDFASVENGMYEGTRVGEGLFFMQTAAGVAQNVIKTAKDMFGDWNLLHENDNVACHLSLAQQATADGYAVVVKPGCTGVVAIFAPAIWRMEQGELVIRNARGESWRFEELEPSTWRRVSENADPLALVKP
jgi:hypothetical protein